MGGISSTWGSDGSSVPYEDQYAGGSGGMFSLGEIKNDSTPCGDWDADESDRVFSHDNFSGISFPFESKVLDGSSCASSPYVGGRMGGSRGKTSP